MRLSKARHIRVSEESSKSYQKLKNDGLRQLGYADLAQGVYKHEL